MRDCAMSVMLCKASWFLSNRTQRPSFVRLVLTRLHTTSAGGCVMANLQALDGLVSTRGDQFSADPAEGQESSGRIRQYGCIPA